jgi:hypothetical protein
MEKEENAKTEEEASEETGKIQVIFLFFLLLIEQII